MGHRKRSRKSSQQMGAEPSVESHQARWQCYPDLRAGRLAPACPAPPCPLLPPGALRARSTALCAPSPARTARLLGAPGASRLLWSSEPGRDCRGTGPPEHAPCRWVPRPMDWFQIGKGVPQGCILSPCLFNFYAEYIMRNTGLEETSWNQDCQEKYQ